jgi:hypothetical protein
MNETVASLPPALSVGDAGCSTEVLPKAQAVCARR